MSNQVYLCVGGWHDGQFEKCNIRSGMIDRRIKSDDREVGKWMNDFASAETKNLTLETEEIEYRLQTYSYKASEFAASESIDILVEKSLSPMDAMKMLIENYRPVQK